MYRFTTHEYEHIARACHAAHNAITEESINWELTTSSHKRTVYSSIEKILIGLIDTPEAAHENFVKNKINDGWEYGPVYSRTNKTNPRLVSFQELSEMDKLKEKVFFNIVESFIIK